MVEDPVGVLGRYGTIYNGYDEVLFQLIVRD